jgi:hypothetical protein
MEIEIARGGQNWRARENIMESVKPDFLKPSDVSIALKISRSKTYEALQRGDIPSINISGLIRIPRRWVDDRVAEAMRAADGKGNE